MGADTPIETVHVPGFRPETLNFFVGCREGKECEGYCWARHKIAYTRWKESPSIECPDCENYIPHIHEERLARLRVGGAKKCFFFSMCEPNDFGEDAWDLAVENFKEAEKNGHIVQVLTHFPMDFYVRRPTWADNVWALGTFNKGKIAFPPNLKARVVGAYVEPILSDLEFDKSHRSRMPNWLVIGAQTAVRGKPGFVPKAHWITKLILNAELEGIPIFVKSHPVWARIGLEWIDKRYRNFPEGFNQ